MSSIKTIRFLGLLLTILMVPMSQLAQACTICIAYPQKSDADYLLESHCVVLAREDPSRPFSYAATEVLKGEFDGREIDKFLDSLTRRILASDVNRSVVLVQKIENGSWHSLGLASSAYESVVRRIILHAQQWDRADGNAQRLTFFLPLFGHKDRDVSRLAYLEIGRAPYHAIKQLGRVVTREQLEPMLLNPQYLRWRSLSILLLGQSSESRDKQTIADSFHSAERLSMTSNLAAWAAAAIEVEGAEAVSFIQNRYFGDTERSKEELAEVIKALSLHGSEGHVHLRDQIVASYKVLLEVHPETAGLIANDLLAWKRTDLAGQLSHVILDSRLQPNDRKTIRQLLRMMEGTPQNAID